MVAIRVADLVSPAGEGLGKDGRTALVAVGARKIGTGDLVVFCRPVAVAAAVVSRYVDLCPLILRSRSATGTNPR